MHTDNIAQINEIIAEYFNSHKEDCIPAKKMMSAFISAGVFTKDEKKGLPFRKVLKALDKENMLKKIPFVHAERNEKSTYWYLVREGKQYKSTEETKPISKKQLGINKRINSDKNYILNICDALLKDTASRQHRFSFLLGDFHRDKKSRTKLPVDGFYEKLNLVIEYHEKQHNQEASDSDQPTIKTVSGVSRDEQRKIYNLRRRDVLQRKNINLVEINFYAFENDSESNIIRNKEKDTEIVQGFLKDYLQLKALKKD